MRTVPFSSIDHPARCRVAIALVYLLVGAACDDAGPPLGGVEDGRTDAVASDGVEDSEPSTPAEETSVDDIGEVLEDTPPDVVEEVATTADVEFEAEVIDAEDDETEVQDTGDETGVEEVEDAAPPLAPVGATCNEDAECALPSPRCLLPVEMLLPTLADSVDPVAQELADLARLAFPGRYCANAVACHDDAACAPGGVCFRPFSAISPDDFTAAVAALELGEEDRAAVFGLTELGLCLAPCRGIDECPRAGYRCAAPLPGLSEALGVSASADGSYCLGLPPSSPCAVCDVRATCLRGAGGAIECRCPPGYDGDGTHCAPIAGACALGCGANASCDPATDRCRCAPGFAGDPALGCHDIDECALGLDDCAPAASCGNLRGTYTCTCRAGYHGDGRTCLPDECALGTHDCSRNATCEDTEHGYRCRCLPDFVGDGFVCRADECALGIDRCSPHATCADTEDGYTCTCAPHYLGDGFVCRADECALELDDCAPEATCTDTADGYTCACRPGFRGDGRSCTPDECALGTDDCAPNATCTDTADGFECACPPLWVGDGRRCAPDECALGTDNCDPNATCEDAEIGFTCTCHEGFRGGGHTCDNVDECAEGRDDCSELARCDDTFGGYTCTCLPGHVGDGRTCTLDECALELDDCDVNARCVDTVAGWDCRCRFGWAGDGVVCTPNECEQGTDDCHPDAICHDTPELYTCSCLEGYRGDGKSCEEIDECAEGLDDCHPDAICDNTPGAYSCTCAPGFAGDGRVCAPDECAQGTDDCAEDAICTDTLEGFECSCQFGYVGDGRSCLPDECALGLDDCSANADCLDTAEGYTCTCRPGYVGDGVTCIADECALGTDDCSPDADCLDTVDGYLCTCHEGFIGDGVVCDRDQCALGTAECSPFATCTDEVPGFTCTCEPGYEGDGFVCTETDECDPNPCENGGACEDGFLSYSCTCVDGHSGERCEIAPEPRYCDVVYPFLEGTTEHGEAHTYLSTNLSTSNSRNAVGENATTPPGVSTPFVPESFPRGYLRLRFRATWDGQAPIAGTTSIIEYYLPGEVTDSPASGTTVTGDVDYSAGLLAPFDAGSSSWTLERACAAIATGTTSGTTLSWHRCDLAPPPAFTADSGTPSQAQLDWTYAKSQIDAAGNPGCLNDISVTGNTTCSGSFCGFVPEGVVGIQAERWAQKLPPITFSKSSYASARISFVEMTVPDAVGGDGEAYYGSVGRSSAPGELIGCGTLSELSCETQ